MALLMDTESGKCLPVVYMCLLGSGKPFQPKELRLASCMDDSHVHCAKKHRQCYPEVALHLCEPGRTIL